jgi:hypothetical protein
VTVSNVYKFFGVDDVTSTAAQTMFGTTVVNGVTKQNPLVNETYIIKSIIVLRPLKQRLLQPIQPQNY